MFFQNKSRAKTTSLSLRKEQTSSNSKNNNVTNFVETIFKKKKVDMSLLFKRAYKNAGSSLDKKEKTYTKKVNNDEINSGSENFFEISSANNKQRQRNSNSTNNTGLFSNFSRGMKGSLALLSFALIFVVFSFVTVFAYNNSQSISLATSNQGEVQGVSESIDPATEEPEMGEFGTDAYQDWIVEKTGNIELAQGDLDSDGLTNMEEFLISTDPLNVSTCGGDLSDSQKLVNLIDPVTCSEINVDDKASIKKYEDVIDINKIKKNLYEDIINEEPALETTPVADTSDGSLISIFGAESIEDLNGKEIDTTNIEKQIEVLQQQASYVDLIEKVDQYIQKSRSLEPFDRDYAVPVSGAVYVDVSIRYDVPLKYVLAVAQRESRFGTDRYTKNGNLTRPGQYQNIYSMGLDDSGNNIGFETWEKGVESFGKWYRRFDDAGVSDCRKWRIYNPNGDYCAHINETSSQIEFFLR